jgi:hypothetical protein
MEDRMSRQPIPYPSDFEIDYHADRQEERRRRALTTLTVADVLSELDALVAQEPDPTKHSCHGLVNWLLDGQPAVHGGDFWDAWKRLAGQAIDRLVDEALSRGED